MPRNQKKTKQSAKKMAKKPANDGIDAIWKSVYYHVGKDHSKKQLVENLRAIKGQGDGIFRKIALLEKASFRDPNLAAKAQKWVAELKKLAANDHQAVRETLVRLW